MSTSVVQPTSASKSQARDRVVGLSLAGLVLAAGIGLGLSADRSGPAPVVATNVAQFEPSVQARRLQKIAEHRAELAARKTPVDGSIRRS